MVRRAHEYAEAYARLLLEGAPQRKRPPEIAPEATMHVWVAHVVKARRKRLVLCQHSSEGIDSEIGLGRAEVHVVYALAENALVDAQHRPDSLRGRIVVE